MPAGNPQGIAPASSEAEVSVLGAMLIDADARSLALSRLEPADFHGEARRRLFRAFSRLERRGQTDVDVTLLADELRASGDLEPAGGLGGLAQLVDAVPTAANVEAHADRLRELRGLRGAQAVGEALILSSAEAGPGEAAAVLEDARDRLRELGERAVASDAGRLRTAREILEDPDARRTPATVAERLAWAGRVTMLAGREKSGKSTLLRWAVARRTCGDRVWSGPPVGEPLGVLYYGQEVPVDVAADLDRLGADLDRVHIADMRTFTSRLPTLVRDVEALRPALVVVDTLSTLTALMELDPGSAADWEPVMDRLGALAQQSDAALVLSHHARKSDGEYRDSTAIGAGVDCILELRRAPAEGESVRSVTARARSALPTSGFRYALHDTGAAPRLELVDGSLSLEERVQRFVAHHEGCSQREVIGGVRGKDSEVRDGLKALCDDGPLIEDDSATPYQYRPRQNPRGTGTETGRKRSGNADTGKGGESVSSGAPPSYRGGRQETPAEPVEGEP